ncbi:hypothetical protein BGZ63DRAFT_428592 [Mariannaea sp. PMI_226]|nr:hypothetical protein BGZ63DRAFT_428592 [Mariannaea sp. PMI_226]
MKVAPLELDPGGDVELVLGFDESIPAYESELGWLQPKSKDGLKQLTKPQDWSQTVPEESQSANDERTSSPLPPEEFSDSFLPYTTQAKPSIDHKTKDIPENDVPTDVIPEDDIPDHDCPEDDCPPPESLPGADERDIVDAPVAIPEPEAFPEPAEPTEPDIFPEPDTIPEPRASPALSATNDSDVAKLSANNLDHEIPTRDIETPGELAVPETGAEEYQLQLLVSSRHLSLASSVFRELLDQPPSEPVNGVDQSLRRLILPSWDPEALLIVMDIIHGHHRDVPRSVTLKTLVDVALIVDHYRIHEITEIFSEIWMRNLPQPPPDVHGNLSIVYLFLAWVFSDIDLFKAMTALAILHCEGPINTMLLPIPEAILEDVLEKRRQLLLNLFDIPYELVERLLNSTDSSFNTSGLLLGCLIREMHANGFPLSKPENYVWEFSVIHLKNTILGFQSPQANKKMYGTIPSYGLPSAVEEVLADLEGLDLEDYVPANDR